MYQGEQRTEHEVRRFTIPPKAWAAIGALVPGPRSVVSALGERPHQPLDEAHRAHLREIGLLDEQDALTPEARHAMEVLARAQVYARLRLLLGGRGFDTVFYYAPDGDGAVSISATADGLLVTDPAPIAEVMGQLKQFTGDSVVFGTAFQAEMSFEEALALAAMIDLHRKSLLRALLEKREPDALSFDAVTVREAIENTEESGQWLVHIVRYVTGYGEPLREGEVGSALPSLAQAGHLISEGNTYRLNDTLKLLAARHLTVDKVLVFEAGSGAADGRVGEAGFCCWQAGVNDLLLVEHRDQVRLTSINAAALLSIVQAFLEEPPIVAAAGPTCSKCGAPLSPGQRFCGQCGAAVEVPAAVVPKVQFCTNCGQPIDVDSRFCPECGAEVG